MSFATFTPVHPSICCNQQQKSDIPIRTAACCPCPRCCTKTTNIAIQNCFIDTSNNNNNAGATGPIQQGGSEIVFSSAIVAAIPTTGANSLQNGFTLGCSTGSVLAQAADSNSLLGGGAGMLYFRVTRNGILRNLYFTIQNAQTTWNGGEQVEARVWKAGTTGESSSIPPLFLPTGLVAQITYPSRGMVNVSTFQTASNKMANLSVNAGDYVAVNVVAPNSQTLVLGTYANVGSTITCTLEFV